MSNDIKSAIDSKNIKNSASSSQGDLTTFVLVESQASETAVDGHTTTVDTHDVIIVVSDPNGPLGKCFELKEDGTVSKSANVKLTLGLAVQHHVSTATQLKALLEGVGNDPHAAIINSYFPDIPIGEKFAILSTNEMATRRDIPATDREKLIGVHKVEFQDRLMKAVCRLRENMVPSSWVLIDRDVDEQTPEEHAELDEAGFLEELDKLLPGIKSATVVVSKSSSSRVLKDGQSISKGNGHMFVKVADPLDIDRVRNNIIPKAIELGLAWQKPKFSKANPGEVVAHSWATLIDQSVWNPGRLIFCGKPTVKGDLEVLPPEIKVRMALKSSIDTVKVEAPDVDKVGQLTRKAGAELKCSVSNGVITAKANDLHLDTIIETQYHGNQTVRELLSKSEAGKVRCQAPFRESSSWAAFLKINKSGIPFVYDSGTNITHWLVGSDHAAVKAIKAGQVVDQLLVDVKTDDASVLEPNVIEALAYVKVTDPAEYQRKRGLLKKANKKVPLTALDEAVKACLSDNDGPTTHHGYAKDLINSLAFEDWPPVAHNGTLHVVEPTTNLWVPLPIDVLQRDVAEAFDGLDNCQRGSDYKAIAIHTISLVNGKAFFDGAPYGIASPGGFFSIHDGEVTVETLSPDHRQRYGINIVPLDQPTPLFDKFLHETFESPGKGEEDQQRRLLQELAGAIMLGLMPKFQKAIFFYDPFGRAGKGTLERMLRELVPSHYVTAVSPFSWDSDYHTASLAPSRLNVVGELPDHKPIPAAIFKSVLGGDLITGRHPTHRPFTFRNEAAHLFMSNHFISTQDYSEAFFTRWIILEFPNSRLRTGLPIDPNLAGRIVGTEMPGIAFWALEGARRLLESGKFSESIVHDRLMGEWRRNRNSLEMFIHERCRLDPGLKIKRSDLYVTYKEWCGDSGKKPFGKSKVKDLLERTAGYGISHSRPNGIETFNGVGIIDESFKPLIG